MNGTVRRSALFTPADDDEMMRKAVKTAADAVIFDLEDAVPTDHLPDARENLKTVTHNLDTQTEIGVRINGIGTKWWLDDLKAATTAGVNAVHVPKVEAAAEVSTVADTLATLTDNPPTVRVAIETPTGLLSANDIAARAAMKPTVAGISFGIADYAQALAAPGPTKAVREQLAFRISSIASAHGLSAFASTHLDIDDKNGLREIAESSRVLGFDGMSAIHPDQLSIINDTFTPNEECVKRARRLIEAYESATSDSIRVDGEFLDEATVAYHRSLVERYETINDGR